MDTTPLWVSYYRLTRIHLFPAGADVFFWPCAWALTLAAYAQGVPPPRLGIQLLAFLVGSVLRHNADCIWNDVCDRDFDRQVERTRNRPIASGAVSVLGAMIFLTVHCAVCLLLLAYAGRTPFQLGIYTLFLLDLPYPLMKRWTYWPQAFLGLTISAGIPIAWLSIAPSLNWTVVAFLALGSTCWTIHYDTIYGCQDRRDDVKAGVRSTAVLFGSHVRSILSMFAGTFVACLAYVGVLNNQGFFYYAVTVFGTAAHLAWQLITIDFDLSADCWKMFTANGTLGYFICGGMLLDYAQQFVL